MSEFETEPTRRLNWSGGGQPAEPGPNPGAISPGNTSHVFAPGSEATISGSNMPIPTDEEVAILALLSARRGDYVGHQDIVRAVQNCLPPGVSNDRVTKLAWDTIRGLGKQGLVERTTRKGASPVFRLAEPKQTLFGQTVQDEKPQRYPKKTGNSRRSGLTKEQCAIREEVTRWQTFRARAVVFLEERIEHVTTHAEILNLFPTIKKDRETYAAQLMEDIAKDDIFAGRFIRMEEGRLKYYLLVKEPMQANLLEGEAHRRMLIRVIYSALDNQSQGVQYEALIRYLDAQFGSVVDRRDIVNLLSVAKSIARKHNRDVIDEIRLPRAGSKGVRYIGFTVRSN